MIQVPDVVRTEYEFLAIDDVRLLHPRLGTKGVWKLVAVGCCWLLLVCATPSLQHAISHTHVHTHASVQSRTDGYYLELMDLIDYEVHSLQVKRGAYCLQRPHTRNRNRNNATTQQQ